jgi:PadR family transcriptional regulator PadR
VQYSDEDRDRRITQLRKGILELAVMGVLYHERHYGYSLVRALTETGSISLKEGTIYPILARLDRDGLVRSEWVESDQGPPRKYYALTTSGRQMFDELSKELDAADFPGPAEVEGHGAVRASPARSWFIRKA